MSAAAARERVARLRGDYQHQLEADESVMPLTLELFDWLLGVVEAVLNNQRYLESAMAKEAKPDDVRWDIVDMRQLFERLLAPMSQPDEPCEFCGEVVRPGTHDCGGPVCDPKVEPCKKCGGGRRVTVEKLLNSHYEACPDCEVK